MYHYSEDVKQLGLLRPFWETDKSFSKFLQTTLILKSPKLASKYLSSTHTFSFTFLLNSNFLQFDYNQGTKYSSQSPASVIPCLNPFVSSRIKTFFPFFGVSVSREKPLKSIIELHDSISTERISQKSVSY